MARAISNVVIATDTFAQWISVTNQMADTFTNYALTANAHANGAQVTGNSALIGIFAANTLAVVTTLRGGTVETPGDLTIGSNTIFTGGSVLKSVSNVWFETSNVFINATSVRVLGGVLNATSNVAVNAANVSVIGTNTTISGGALNITSNIAVTVANITINATALTIRDGAFNVNSAVSISNTTSLNANVTVGGTRHTIAGNVEFDTNVLFVDATNNRVGINNSAPDASLSVTGTANVSGNTAIGGDLIVRGTGIVNGAITIANTLASGNTTITGFANISSTLAAGNTTITGFANVVGTLNTTANATVNGVFQVNNTSVFADSITLKTDVVFDTVTNTNIGNANSGGNFTAADVLVLTKPFAYRAAKITSSVASLNLYNYQTQEMIVAFANSANDVSITSFGVVNAPTSANLGVFTTSINSTAMALKFTQTSANSNVKLLIQYIK